MGKGLSLRTSLQQHPPNPRGSMEGGAGTCTFSAWDLHFHVDVGQGISYPGTHRSPQGSEWELPRRTSSRALADAPSLTLQLQPLPIPSLLPPLPPSAGSLSDAPLS